MLADAKFLFMVCQVGAEGALKGEMARRWPDYRFAFSRPGFITFKLPPDLKLAADFDPGCTLARTSGFSLGKVKGTDAETAARAGWELIGNLACDHLHVWQRDAALPGVRGFEPGVSPLAEEVGRVLLATRPAGQSPHEAPPLNALARPGQTVLDCVLVEPNEWWIGWHLAATTPQQWPGGVPLLKKHPEVLSRAYYKMLEALAWSRLPIKAGDVCAEIGSAPGGAAEALLEKKLMVLGIDPAEMDESILENPHFKHLRKRAADVKRREFRTVKWLFADSNVSPQQTLDHVESIVTHREVHIRGLLLTLKVSDWKLVERIPKWCERVRSWGYSQVSTRQLAFNRREICLAALRVRG